MKWSSRKRLSDATCSAMSGQSIRSQRSQLVAAVMACLVFAKGPKLASASDGQKAPEGTVSGQLCVVDGLGRLSLSSKVSLADTKCPQLTDLTGTVCLTEEDTIVVETADEGSLLAKCVADGPFPNVGRFRQNETLFLTLHPRLDKNNREKWVQGKYRLAEYSEIGEGLFADMGTETESMVHARHTMCKVLETHAGVLDLSHDIYLLWEERHGNHQESAWKLEQRIRNTLIAHKDDVICATESPLSLRYLHEFGRRDKIIVSDDYPDTHDLEGVVFVPFYDQALEAKPPTFENRSGVFARSSPDVHSEGRMGRRAALDMLASHGADTTTEFLPHHEIISGLARAAYRPIVHGDTPMTSATVETWMSGAIPILLEGHHHTLFTVPNYDWSAAARVRHRGEYAVFVPGSPVASARLLACRLACFVKQVRSVLDGMNPTAFTSSGTKELVPDPGLERIVVAPSVNGLGALLFDRYEDGYRAAGSGAWGFDSVTRALGPLPGAGQRATFTILVGEARMLCEALGRAGGVFSLTSTGEALFLKPSEKQQCDGPSGAADEDRMLIR